MMKMKKKKILYIIMKKEAIKNHEDKKKDYIL